VAALVVVLVLVVQVTLVQEVRPTPADQGHTAAPRHARSTRTHTHTRTRTRTASVLALAHLGAPQVVAVTTQGRAGIEPTTAGGQTHLRTVHFSTSLPSLVTSRRIHWALLVLTSRRKSLGEQKRLPNLVSVRVT
jgi:hypothetical protein